MGEDQLSCVTHLQRVRNNKEQLNKNNGGLRSKKSLISPTPHRTAKFERSTMQRATRAWNEIKPELRLLDDTTKFKILVQREVTRAQQGRFS